MKSLSKKWEIDKNIVRIRAVCLEYKTEACLNLIGTVARRTSTSSFVKVHGRPMSAVFVRLRITIKLPTMSTIRLTGGGRRGNNDRGSTLSGEFKDSKGVSLANGSSFLLKNVLKNSNSFSSPMAEIQTEERLGVFEGSFVDYGFLQEVSKCNVTQNARNVKMYITYPR